MPELPEAERARQVLHDSTRNLVITKVETTKDDIIFVDMKEGQFESTLVGRTVVSAERRGKLFWLNLSGPGKHPLFHLGMTGMIQLKDGEPVLYQSRSSGSDEQWPPRFWKFVIHLEPVEGTSTSPPVQIAFLDGRRLGRIRLLDSPADEPPVSLLGPDPIISPPSVETLSALLLKRKSPIKSVLLDQAVCAGVGNWVADEILFQSHVHPLQLASSLSPEQITLLRNKMIDICTTAVAVRADSSKFPNDWLFGVRWGKGKGKGKDAAVTLADGSLGKVEFITIGGRTAAFVPSIQLAPDAASSPKARAPSKKKSAALDSSASPSLSRPPPAIKKLGRKRKSAAVKEDTDENSDDSEDEVIPPPTSRRRTKAKIEEA